jgi:hypothetical protein
MPPRRAVDLDVPAEPRPAEEPLPANVLDFSTPPRLGFVVSPIAVHERMQRQRKRASSKAVARHARRMRRQRP